MDGAGGNLGPRRYERLETVWWGPSADLALLDGTDEVMFKYEPCHHRLDLSGNKSQPKPEGDR